MKQMVVEDVAYGKEVKKMAPPPPPPLPPASRLLVSWKLPVESAAAAPSLTNREIAKYWKQKRKIEEDHFLDAMKAAARIRARNLSVEDYKRFEASLKEAEDDNENEMVTESNTKYDEIKKETRVGIKDWWTKSKYAYLNEPAVKSMDKQTSKRRGSSYVPQLHCYKSLPMPVTSTFGIF